MRPSERIEEIEDREKWRQEAMDELRAEIKRREDNLVLVQVCNTVNPKVRCKV